MLEQQLLWERFQQRGQRGFVNHYHRKINGFDVAACTKSPNNLFKLLLRRRNPSCALISFAFLTTPVLSNVYIFGQSSSVIEKLLQILLKPEEMF